MFADYVFEKTSAAYHNKIILLDVDNLAERTEYIKAFEEQGFTVAQYEDDLHFRVEFDKLIYGDEKCVVLALAKCYIPYDLTQKFEIYELSLGKLFPKLDSYAVKNYANLNYDLLTIAYLKNFADLTKTALTNDFIEKKVYSKENIETYLTVRLDNLKSLINAAMNYQDWICVANLKAEIDVLRTEYEIPIDAEFTQKPFLEFVLSNFGKLSSVMNRKAPVLVSGAMEYMKDHSDKFAIVVMDGMSEFDWRIISKSFSEIKYEKADSFAMIPSTTSISRQCLLSGKYPSQLISPWTQSKEKQEFTDCARDLGFTDAQIGYERGYNAQFSSTVKCAAVIINDVDDMVHGQKQGRIGMFNDISILTKESKLADLTRRLLNDGFDVYIGADHGNTPCVGTGKLMRTGVETETKSRRMIVLKDFADKQSLLEQHGMIEYPKYYLNKECDYLICDIGKSFDVKGESVMTHGGITVDEVIVPFIKIKAGENNG